jgi:hypothetical protein
MRVPADAAAIWYGDSPTMPTHTTAMNTASGSTTTAARLSAITLAPRTSISANARVSASSTTTPRGPGTPMPSAIRMKPSVKAPFGVIARAQAPWCAAWR